MSDTTVIGVADGVAAYVSEVRAELADLPLEDVDDLTGRVDSADVHRFVDPERDR
jgi:hypothetical protein